MIWRMLEVIPAAEQILHKPFDTGLAVSIPLPIEDREHGRHRDCVDTVLTLEQVRIILLGELTERVEVLEFLGERDVHQMQPGIRRDLAEEIDRLWDHA